MDESGNHPGVDATSREVSAYEPPVVADVLLEFLCEKKILIIKSATGLI